MNQYMTFRHVSDRLWFAHLKTRVAVQRFYALMAKGFGRDEPHPRQYILHVGRWTLIKESKEKV